MSNSVSYKQMEGVFCMSKLTQMSMSRIKRSLSKTKADEELLHEFLVYASDMDCMEIIALLINSVLALDSKLIVANSKLKEKDEEIRLLNNEIQAIKERVQLTAYQKNQCKMKSGRPIALKGKYSDVLALELQGLSDAEICQKLGGISKTTLWRYRKQVGVSKK